MASNDWLKADSNDDELRALARRLAYAAGGSPFVFERLLVAERTIEQLKLKIATLEEAIETKAK